MVQRSRTNSEASRASGSSRRTSGYGSVHQSTESLPSRRGGGSRPASRTSRHSSRTGRPASRINRPVSLINRPGSRTSQRSRGSQDTDYPTAEPSPSTKRKHRVGVDANAPLWEVYFEETTISDRETIKGWTGSLESLLLITGLFSGVVTGFAVTEMSPEPNDSFANTLVKFLSLGPAAEALLEAVNIPISVQRELYNELSTPPPPSALSIATVLFWSISVTCTLCIFVYAFYVKFWLHEFRRDLRNGSLYDYARRRQARWDAMLKFKVEEWVLGLPLLMHLAVIFFFLGFIMKLWSYHRISAYVVTVLAILLLVIYMGMTVMPAFREMCPYHNTAMTMVPKIFSSLWSWFGAAGRRMLMRMPISFLRRTPEPVSQLTPNIDLEKGNMESVSTFPLYRAHPKSDREEEFVEKYSKELKWNMVVFLLTTCRRPSSVDLALKSIRTLPYVPRKAYELLSTGIPRLLYSKILTDGEDISKEDESWVAEETYEFTLSFIYLLKCIALDGGDTDNLTSLVSLPMTSPFATYGRLDAASMQVWAKYKTADPLPEQVPLPAKNFVALISMETLFYHLHPQTTKQDDDPMHDMRTLLDWHVTDKAPLDGRSLALLLDSLLYVLPRMTDARVKHRALCLLVRVVGTLTQEDSLVFRPLASCFTMLIDGEAGTPFLREHMDAPRESHFVCGRGSGHEELFDVLGMISVPDGDDELKSDIVWAAFSLASTTVTVEAALSQSILRENCTMLATKFNPKKDLDEWTVDFFTSVYDENQSDLSTLHHLLLRILRSLPTSTTNLRQEFASRILQGFKSRLHNADVVDVEKAKICLELFEAMREDKTLFLIFTVTKDRWFNDFRDLFTSVLDGDEKLKSDIVWAAFSLASATITVEAALSEPMLREHCAMLATRFDPEKDLDEWSVDFFTSVYEESQSADLSTTLMHLLRRILRSLSTSTTDLRHELACQILQCFKSRLLNADAVDVEKGEICRQLFDAMRDDKTLFLIFTVTKNRWFDGLKDVFLSVQGSIMPDVNRLLLVWDAVGKFSDADNILSDKDTWDTLRALS